MNTKSDQVHDDLGHHSIQIMNIPEGEAPLDVRKAWVGLVLPAHPFVGYGGTQEKGAVTSSENIRKSYSYSVPQDKALLVLARSDQKAALWWKDHGYPKAGDDENCFSFPLLIAREVCGKFEHQKILHITEEV